MISGFKSTQGVQGIGIKRAPSQDQNDPRPYLEFVLFAVLLGGDSQYFEIVADGFGFDEKVCIVINKDYSYFSIKSLIILPFSHRESYLRPEFY